MQALHEGTWHTLCRDSWGELEQQMVCSSLGFGPVSIATPEYDKLWEPSEFWKDSGAACTGGESLYRECPHEYSFSSESCGTHVLKCEPQVRLADNGVYWHRQGVVQVYREGQWLTLCDKDWDTAAADIVCKQLGHGSSESLDAELAYPPVLTNLSAVNNSVISFNYWSKTSTSSAVCRGGEKYLRECPQTLDSVLTGTCEAEDGHAQVVCGECSLHVLPLYLPTHNMHVSVSLSLALGLSVSPFLLTVLFLCHGNRPTLQLQCKRARHLFVLIYSCFRASRCHCGQLLHRASTRAHQGTSRLP